MILCTCGCGTEIIIKKHHRWRGIPKYIKGHYFKTEKSKQEVLKINIGRKQTKNHINKRSISLKGRISPNKNKCLSNDHKNKISQSNLGKIVSNETIYKISKSRTGKCCGEKNCNWKGGKSFEPYCPKFNNKKKEEIRNQYDRRCYICGKHESDNITKNNKIRKLCVHHIDEDKEQGCNGKQWKLIPLCLSCHLKLHNSKKMEI